MNAYSPRDLIACARRELAIRTRVYPNRVSKGWMQADEAAREIDLMRLIVAQLEGKTDIRQRELDL